MRKVFMLVLVVGFLIGTCAIAGVCEETACQEPVDFSDGGSFVVDGHDVTLPDDGEGGGGGPPIPG
ncbi:MAG: hypothetical protein AYK19_14500 [Theionarchaea archaeon DG-70-1]|nr:MAG: hypothetical protein AYK19_14500 [Theionarchaea archaeon DG-70-1]